MNRCWDDRVIGKCRQKSYLLAGWNLKDNKNSGLRVAIFIGTAIALAVPATGKAERRAKRAFVAASIAKIRQAPNANAKVLHQLRIGTEVEVISVKRQGGKLYQKVRTPFPGETGWTRASFLSRQRPTLKALLEKADSAGSPSRARHWLLRATALRPGDVKVIERLLKNYRARGKRKGAYVIDKGLIAAERRVLSWDGPLYPIIDGQALLPRAPFPEMTATSRRTATIERDRKTLRGRAFPLVNSGKVVALTEAGYRTRHLDAPVTVEGDCGPQAGFALKQPSASGALVPSWLVAGFRVYPFQQNSPDTFVDSRQQLTVRRRGDHDATITATTFDAPRVLFDGALLRAGARPLVQMAEHERHWLVLFSAPGTRDCCLNDRELWLMRFTLDDEDTLRTETGRVYNSGFAPACSQQIFTDLQGEPRCERLPEGCELSDPRLP